MTRALALGLDFGTGSARALLLDLRSGEILATAVAPYHDGVIDERLPESLVPLPPVWALQNPQDWLDATEQVTREVLSQSGVDGEAVLGIGIDFTACTVLPATGSGVPLCLLPAYRNLPHAWPKLWKHHAAQPQADRVNLLAAERGEPWLPRYGGKISSEWLLPKALQLLEEAPDLYAAADLLIEGGDWLAWQLTGNLARNVCAAGYKATWHRRDGFPSPAYLSALNPAFASLYEEKVRGTLVAPGKAVGALTPEWAARLGLSTETVVAAPIIDAHAGVLGAGVTTTGVMVLAMGTSTCHMLMSENEQLVEGISGVVEGGIVPGLFGYEAGQAGVGDIFAWFVENGVPPVWHDEASRRGISLHDVLVERASALNPGASGLLALDWWNGCRSTLVDAELSGLLVGMTLQTRPEEIYRALIEATAYGTRLIIETFVRQGVPVDALVAGGGLTKNPLLMQIYADVTGRAVEVAGSGLASAVGAAMLGAVAAGSARGGCDSLADAARLAPRSTVTYHPIAEHRERYDILYREYVRLYDTFGRGGNDVMKVLHALRH